jgi:hypothetical protein
VRRTDGNQVAVFDGMEGDISNDADAEPEPYICLDDIRVAGGKRHIRRQSRLGERVIQGRRTRETENVGDDRVRREIRERGLRDGRQRMPFGYHNIPMPVVTR